MEGQFARDAWLQLGAAAADRDRWRSLCERLVEALEDIVERDKAPIDPNWPGLKPAGMRQIAEEVLAATEVRARRGGRKP